MRGPIVTVISLVALLVAGAGCSSSSTTHRDAARPKAVLEFRAVQYSGDTPLTIPNEIKVRGTGTVPGDGRSCAALAAESDRSGVQEAVLFDRTPKFCYVLGPVLLNGDRIDAAAVAFDSTMQQWVVDIHFETNEFVTRVAQPLVNRVVAIVLDGVVQSAPQIHPGITGHDVQIAGGYTRSEAIAVAASIRGVSPSKVRVGPRDS
jgi:preprotein translocase subunit SecD